MVSPGVSLKMPFSCSSGLFFFQTNIPSGPLFRPYLPGSLQSLDFCSALVKGGGVQNDAVY